MATTPQDPYILLKCVFMSVGSTAASCSAALNIDDGAKLYRDTIWIINTSNTALVVWGVYDTVTTTFFQGVVTQGPDPLVLACAPNQDIWVYSDTASTGVVVTAVRAA